LWCVNDHGWDSSTAAYYLTLKEDGKWLHECKARQVYGDSYECRHIKMILGKYFVNDRFKHLYNISPIRKKGNGKGAGEQVS
jgi:hypothetical protein